MIATFWKTGFRSVPLKHHDRWVKINASRSISTTISPDGPAGNQAIATRPIAIEVAESHQTTPAVFAVHVSACVGRANRRPDRDHLVPGSAMGRQWLVSSFTKLENVFNSNASKVPMHPTLVWNYL